MGRSSPLTHGNCQRLANDFEWFRMISPQDCTAQYRAVHLAPISIGRHQEALHVMHIMHIICPKDAWARCSWAEIRPSLPASLQAPPFFKSKLPSRSKDDLEDADVEATLGIGSMPDALPAASRRHDRIV